MSNWKIITEVGLPLTKNYYFVGGKYGLGSFSGEAWFDGDTWIFPFYADDAKDIYSIPPEVLCWMPLPSVPNFDPTDTKDGEDV